MPAKNKKIKFTLTTDTYTLAVRAEVVYLESLRAGL
jgi:hypothetical protein